MSATTAAEISQSLTEVPYPPLTLTSATTAAELCAIKNGGIASTGTAYPDETYPADAYIGYQSNGAGSVLIDGAGSKWAATTATFYVGYNGSGTLSLTNGANITMTSGVATRLGIAYGAGSTGFVTVDSGSVWKQVGECFYVGGGTDGTNFSPGGNATLLVTNGGTITGSTEARVGVWRKRGGRGRSRWATFLMDNRQFLGWISRRKGDSCRFPRRHTQHLGLLHRRP